MSDDVLVVLCFVIIFIWMLRQVFVGHIAFEHCKDFLGSKGLFWKNKIEIKNFEFFKFELSSKDT